MSNPGFNKEKEYQREPSRATMKEIASLSGLSRATVSAVLNGKPGVSEKSRMKVLTAVRENNLHHRLMARSLMGHFSQMFAVVVPDIQLQKHFEGIAKVLLLFEMSSPPVPAVSENDSDDIFPPPQVAGNRIGYIGHALTVIG